MTASPKAKTVTPKKETTAEPKGIETQKVTSPVDLRIVARDFAVFRLDANVPKELPKNFVLEAQRTAAEKGVELKVG